jgi:hypothetical protein
MFNIRETLSFRPFDAVRMKRILLLALCLLGIIGTASAYGLYLDCPASVQVGLPVKCSVDSDLPAGYTFDLVFYQSQYTATELGRQSVTIQDSHNTQYKIFDTVGLSGGSYKVEAQLSTKTGETSLRSDSVTYKLVQLVDRSGEITITSPVTQNLAEALRIEGSVSKLGDAGVQLEVRGPDGRIFGPQYIGTKNDVKDGSGVFTQKVLVTTPGTYEVSFTDTKSFIGIKKFEVVASATATQTTVPATAVRTTHIPTTAVPTTIPTTQSPLSSFVAIGGLAGAVLLALAVRK